MCGASTEGKKLIRHRLSAGSSCMVGLWPHRAFTFRLVVALPLEQHSPRFASVIDPLGIARLSSAGRIK
jgi:hypothetical protein